MVNGLAHDSSCTTLPFGLNWKTSNRGLFTAPPDCLPVISARLRFSTGERNSRGKAPRRCSYRRRLPISELMAPLILVSGLRLLRIRIRSHRREFLFYWGKIMTFEDYCVAKRRWCGRVDSNHHGIATASPSSWCVCQFRHDRTEVRTHCSRAW